MNFTQAAPPKAGSLHLSWEQTVFQAGRPPAMWPREGILMKNREGPAVLSCRLPRENATQQAVPNSVPSAKARVCREQEPRLLHLDSPLPGTGELHKRCGKRQPQGVNSPSLSGSPASGLCTKTAFLLFLALIRSIAWSRKSPKGPPFRSPRLGAQCGNAPNRLTNGFCYFRACKPLGIQKRACLRSIAEPTLKSPAK